MNSISKTKRLNFSWYLLKTLNWVFFQEVFATVSFHKMSTACRIFVLSNALIKVSCCVPDTMCMARITRETVNNALSIYN